MNKKTKQPQHQNQINSKKTSKKKAQTKLSEIQHKRTYHQHKSHIFILFQGQAKST